MIAKLSHELIFGRRLLKPLFRFFAVAFLLVPLSASDLDKGAAHVLNELLGLSRAEVSAKMGNKAAETGDSNSITWEIVDQISASAQAPTSVTRTNGTMNPDGSWSSTSRTTIKPGHEATTYHTVLRIVYFFDGSGKAFRWETWNAIDPRFLPCPQCSDDPAKRKPPKWLLADAREIKTEKSGKTKLIKPKGDYHSFY